MPLGHLRRTSNAPIRGLVLLRWPTRRLGLWLDGVTPLFFKIQRVGRLRALLSLLVGALRRSGPLLLWRSRRSLLLGGVRQLAGQLYILYGGPATDEGWEPGDERVKSSQFGPAARRDGGDVTVEGPLLSIIIPVYNTPPHLLRACFDSVLRQTYGRWELCVADDASVAQGTLKVLSEYGLRDGRIKVARCKQNSHISAASNLALSLALGEYVVLLDHDDMLHPEALEAIAAMAYEQPDLALIYTDEDRIAPDGRKYFPYFKPDFAPELLEGQNFIGHLAAYRRDVICHLGGFRLGYEGSQDWDLALRVSDAVGQERVGHIPRILYHWRVSENSTAGDVTIKPYASLAAERAIQDHLARLGEDGAHVCRLPWIPGSFRIKRAVPSGLTVSVIVDARISGDSMEATYEVIEQAKHYAASVDAWAIFPDSAGQLMVCEVTSAGGEVIVAEGISRHYGFADACNAAASIANGSLLLFVRAGTAPLRSSSLGELMAHVARANVDAAGGKVFDQCGFVRQAIMLEDDGGKGWSFGAGMPSATAGPLNLLWLTQNVSLLAFDSLMIDRVCYQAAGGLSAECEESTAVAELCRRLSASGRRLIWTPFAEFVSNLAPTDSVSAKGDYGQEAIGHAWRPYVRRTLRGS
ncbi:Glycosyl transferase family 2 [Dyella jiangningensis]|nr:glycosyl transferase family 2 [Dyella sp. AtDHG13]SDK37270.1 Glycosyl transferase family 2 [Dyella jiangningensis]